MLHLCMQVRDELVPFLQLRLQARNLVMKLHHTSLRALSAAGLESGDAHPAVQPSFRNDKFAVLHRQVLRSLTGLLLQCFKRHLQGRSLGSGIRDLQVQTLRTPLDVCNLVHTRIHFNLLRDLARVMQVPISHSFQLPLHLRDAAPLLLALRLEGRGHSEKELAASLRITLIMKKLELRNQFHTSLENDVLRLRLGHVEMRRGQLTSKFIVLTRERSRLPLQGGLRRRAL
mmetsp:Transcript_17322/g.47010  ORF Transcript_17322/g.47010 Transcript_17322/m.47010 type:complete len:230 (-) Transcript_17322:135-824(-)